MSGPAPTPARPARVPRSVRTLRALRTELPFVLVLTVVAASLLYLVVEPGRWGRTSGGLTVAILLAGVLRAIVPERWIGLLAVRGRVVDSVWCLLVGAAVLAVDIRLHW